MPNKAEEIEKGTAHIIVELIEYEHNAVVCKSIMKKATGSINALSFASGEGLNEKYLLLLLTNTIIEGQVFFIDVSARCSCNLLNEN